jgi:hypothetical protein
MIHHGLSRKVKYVSVVACISLAREPLSPNISTSQDIASLREELKKQGVRFGANLFLKLNAKSDVNAKIFLDDIWPVLLSHLAELHMFYDFAEEVGVSLVDNDSNHLTRDLISLLSEARVRIITVGSHTNQISQVLDVTLFGDLKPRPRYELPFEVKSRTMVEPNK